MREKRNPQLERERILVAVYSTTKIYIRPMIHKLQKKIKNTSPRIGLEVRLMVYQFLNKWQ